MLPHSKLSKACFDWIFEAASISEDKAEMRLPSREAFFSVVPEQKFSKEISEMQGTEE